MPIRLERCFTIPTTTTTTTKITTNTTTITTSTSTATTSTATTTTIETPERIITERRRVGGGSSSPTFSSSSSTRRRRSGCRRFCSRSTELFALLFILSLNYCLTVVTSAPINNNNNKNNNNNNNVNNEEEDEIEDDYDPSTSSSSFLIDNTSASKEEFEFIRDQLEKYGYLRGNPTLREFEKSLIQFQEVLDVERTAKIDEATIEAASRPRCVQQDVRRHTNRRQRRFTLSKQAKWKHFDSKSHTVNLKYFISKYTKRIPVDTVDRIVKQAFEIWSSQNALKDEIKVTLNFTKASSKADADIDILWATGEHGDDNNFDGAYGTIKNNMKENVLAHTFFPSSDYPLNGDIHFDDDEDWEIDASLVTPTNQKRFFPYVLAHEIGHALGLAHSKKDDALMYPYYKNVPLDNVKLDIDDKCGINWNYGSNSDFCLFVWLMSEIVHHYSDSNFGYGRNEVNSLSTFRQNKKINPKARLPKCTSGNKIRGLKDEQLIRILQIGADDVKKYTQTLCNFLAGLHMYRASSKYHANVTIEREFAGVQQEVSTFTGASKRSVREVLKHAEQLKQNNQPNILDPSYFDEKFFDNFFKKLSSS